MGAGTCEAALVVDELRAIAARLEARLGRLEDLVSAPVTAHPHA